MTFARDKEVYDNQGNKNMQADIQNVAQPLFIVNPVQFPITASTNVSEAECQVEGTVLTRMADQEEQGDQNEQEPYRDYD